MLASKDDTINDQKAFILQMGIKWQLERHSEVFEFFKATFFLKQKNIFSILSSVYSALFKMTFVYLCVFE